MIRLLPLALLASLASCGDREGRAAAATVETAQPAAVSVATIAPTELAALLEAGDTKLVDVRTPEEFAEGHIEGAVNLPLDTFDPAALDGDQVVLYCHSGRRSAEAAAKLAEHRGEEVVHMDGGITAWTDAGLPVVTP
ncbi:rhodanese-like domain-containing protein [Sphingomicrobium nitratireducens]|uniref:rhodanese-like domain-containing protein n=1 Tax=Sphingomicrobium nitratireducens TaxID=2964666 RepID=UPI00223EEF3F|nr:rhodanese-like domain-containing protein [Sphingomicrobium nitratireducens]